MKRLFFLIQLIVFGVLLVHMASAGAAMIVTKNTKLPWVSDVARICNCVLINQQFLGEVRAVKKYDFTNRSAIEVANDISMSKTIVAVEVYHTRLPWSKATGYTVFGELPPTFYMNLYKNPRKLSLMVNECVHKTMHVLGYSHGDNYAAGKEMSVNYKVGSLAEPYVGRECK